MYIDINDRADDLKKSWLTLMSCQCELSMFGNVLFSTLTPFREISTAFYGILLFFCDDLWREECGNFDPEKLHTHIYIYMMYIFARRYSCVV